MKRAVDCPTPNIPCAVEGKDRTPSTACQCWMQHSDKGHGNVGPVSGQHELRVHSPHPFATGALSEPPTEVEQCPNDEQGGSELQDLLPARTHMGDGVIQMGKGDIQTWIGDTQMGEGDTQTG